MGAADLLRRPLADQFLHVAIVPANAYQRTKFNFLAQLVSEIWGGSQNKKWELLISPDATYRTNFYTGASTRKCLQVCQISSS